MAFGHLLVEAGLAAWAATATQQSVKAPSWLSLAIKYGSRVLTQKDRIKALLAEMDVKVAGGMSLDEVDKVVQAANDSLRDGRFSVEDLKFVAPVVMELWSLRKFRMKQRQLRGVVFADSIAAITKESPIEPVLPIIVPQKEIPVDPNSSLCGIDLPPAAAETPIPPQDAAVPTWGGIDSLYPKYPADGPASTPAETN
jgi:hypothetical protein